MNKVKIKIEKKIQLTGKILDSEHNHEDSHLTVREPYLYCTCIPIVIIPIHDFEVVYKL